MMSVLRASLLKLLPTLVGLCVLAWAFGLVQFAVKLPRSVDNERERTDAIVVLTGGSERIATGVDLLAAGLADKLFISGVGAPLSALELIDEEVESRNRIATQITLGSVAEDTPGNALETAAWIMDEEVGSIRLVTAAYHMPRSLREFESVLPATKIIPHPVFPEQVKEDWWRHPGTATLIAGEYTKYLFAGLRIWTFGALGIRPEATNGADAQ